MSIRKRPSHKRGPKGSRRAKKPSRVLEPVADEDADADEHEDELVYLNVRQQPVTIAISKAKIHNRNSLYNIRFVLYATNLKLRHDNALRSAWPVANTGRIGSVGGNVVENGGYRKWTGWKLVGGYLGACRTLWKGSNSLHFSSIFSCVLVLFVAIVNVNDVDDGRTGTAHNNGQWPAKVLINIW
ncbi:hypothetical protein ACLKA7_006440 [Drosophila subpalustris]